MTKHSVAECCIAYIYIEAIFAKYGVVAHYRVIYYSVNFCKLINKYKKAGVN